MTPEPKEVPTRTRAAVTAAAIVIATGALIWQATRGPVSEAAPAGGQTPPPSTEVPPPSPPAELLDPRPGFLAARATFTCGGATGEAVFVGPERALASIPCQEGQGQVRLSDGRDLLARVLPGSPPGTSVLHLPGASASFLSPGSATGIAEGATLLVGLDGAGPQTVGEAVARGLVPLDGLPLLRAEEAAGPLGGAVVDAAGNLVGIAPSTPPDPARPWLAVPVEAFATTLGRDVPAAWTAAAGQAADEDRRAQSELWNRILRSTVLLSATPGPNGLALVVARASAGRPPAETVRLAVDPIARDCDPTGRIVDWRAGPRAFDGVPVPREIAARLSRLVPPIGGGAVWMGAGLARLDCDPAGVADGATLSIPGSDPPAPVPFPRGGFAGGPGPSDDSRQPVAAVANPVTDLDRAAAAEEEVAWEVGWKKAFREANDRVAQAKQGRMNIQAQRDEARGNFQYVLEQQLDGDLEVARLEEKRAAEALQDLDRRASLAAVPRAWRRAE